MLDLENMAVFFFQKIPITDAEIRRGLCNTKNNEGKDDGIEFFYLWDLEGALVTWAYFGKTTCVHHEGKVQLHYPVKRGHRHLYLRIFL